MPPSPGGPPERSYQLYSPSGQVIGKPEGMTPQGASKGQGDWGPRSAPISGGPSWKSGGASMGLSGDASGRGLSTEASQGVRRSTPKSQAAPLRPRAPISRSGRRRPG